MPCGERWIRLWNGTRCCGLHFEWVEGNPTQVVEERVGVHLEVESLQELEEKAGRRRQRLAAAEATQPFDLEPWPLLRVKLLR